MTNLNTHQVKHALAVESLPIATLIPDPMNARLHPERHIKQLAKSIETFGYNCPVLVDGENNVVAGHGRLLAVMQLGWSEVPVIRLEHLTLDQVRAYRIADNRLTDCSTWDERLLAEQLQDLANAGLDFDLEDIGFDLAEIDLRIQSLGEIEDEPEADLLGGDANSPVVSVIGDVWQLDPHRIVCGNALEQSSYDALLGTQRVDMVFTDAPYNVKIQNISGKGRIQHAEFAMASGEMSREAFTAFLSQSLALAKQACTSGALIYAWMIATRITRPIRQLVEAAERADLAAATQIFPKNGPREVTAAARAIAGMRERLGHQSAERTRMASAMAHDLRNPLTSLRLRAEGLEGPVRSQMISDLDRMARMIQEVLDYARGHVTEDRRAEVDLRELVTQCVYVAREQNISIDFVPPNDPVTVSVDADAIGRAVANLLDNARRYGDRVSVRIVAAADVVIVVEDEGPGIAENELERIVEPFQRGERSRSRSTGGAGLGLAIARDVAVRHEGHCV